MAVMRTFLEGQQKREEGFLAELRGLGLRGQPRNWVRQGQSRGQ